MKERESIQVAPRPNNLRKLLLDNPMQMEAVRFRRRFLNVTESPKLNRAFLQITIALYVAVVAVYFTVASDVVTTSVLFFQLLVTMLVAVLSAHSTIAGERDRRSWELLQVAPITQGQIVYGKFRGILSLILSIQLMFAPFVLISLFRNYASLGLVPVLLFEALCFSSSAFLGATTVYLSSRLKNANATLVTAIALAVGIYAVIPLLISVILTSLGTYSDPPFWRLIWIYHPYFLLLFRGYAEFAPLLLIGLQSVAYLGLTATMLKITTRRLERKGQKE